MSTLWIVSYIALWVIVAGLVAIVLGVLRQLGLIQLRLGPDGGVLITEEGLARGTEAPALEGLDAITGHVVGLRALRGRRVILVFLTPTCVACRQLLPHLDAVARDRRESVQALAVCSGAPGACTELAERLKARVPLLRDPSNAMAARYGVQVTPFAFLIDEHGVILIRGVVNTPLHLDALLDEEGTYQSSPWQQVPLSPAAGSGGENGAAKELVFHGTIAGRPAARADQQKGH